MKTSETVKEIASALRAFQGSVTNPINASENPHFKSKYASLPDIINHVRPLLHEHGLCYFQSAMDMDGKAGVVTLLMHTSGEWIMSDPCLLRDRKDNAQGAGSALTYSRRYSLCAALGIAGEDDDDANTASMENAFTEADELARKKSAELLAVYSARVESAVLAKDTQDLAKITGELSGKKKDFIHPHLMEMGRIIASARAALKEEK